MRIDTARRAVPARGDAGYGVVAYVVMALVGLLIIVGGVLIVRMVAAQMSEAPAATPAPTMAVSECTGSTWFDASTGSCVPKTVCEAGEQYVEEDNSCIVPPPVVNAVEPSSGLVTGGTEIRITGSGFKAGATVTIDGAPAAAAVVNPTTITATTPGSQNLYPVDVIVANPDGGSVVADNAFTYVPLPEQRITDVAPNTGSNKGGEAVIVNGNGFVEGTVVAFGGRAAPKVEVLSDSKLRVLTPVGDLGSVTVNVRNPDDAEAFALEDGFTYVDQPPRRVMLIRPKKGAVIGNTPVTITGTGFEKGATVSIGGNPATDVTFINSTKLTAKAPEGTVGKATVAVRNPGVPAALLVNGFRYVETANILGISPTQGPISGGTKVTINGTGFTPDIVVTIGNLTLTDAKYVDPQTITFKTPPALSPLTVSITVTNPDEPTILLANAFTYGNPVEGTPQAGTDPTDENAPVAQARCPSLNLANIRIRPGATATLTETTLFGGRGLIGPRLTSVRFVEEDGNGQGTSWKADPPLISWTSPSDRPDGMTVVFSYKADNCAGAGSGSTVSISSK